MFKHLLVAHHAPDLDAIGAVWMFKRFDAQHYADAQVAFVDPGNMISASEAERLGFQMHEVTHVDTGSGEFDHHQTERGHERVCATSLVYEYICQLHPEEKNNQALQFLVEYCIQIDHFEEIYWPDAESPRYAFMIHQLLEGFESVDPHNDDSQLQFGLKCLDCAYAALRETFQAAEIVKTGEEFLLPAGKCLAVETKNDGVIKYAQQIGFQLVIRKDPKNGEMRIKARPDADIDLKALADKILTIDHKGSWYYHPSGKMLLNGSRKQRNQRPTPLKLPEVVAMIKEIYV